MELTTMNHYSFIILYSIHQTFSTYFANVISDLQIPNIHKNVSNVRSGHDLVLTAINPF